jgi:Protein of unknown function (DUF2934)
MAGKCMERVKCWVKSMVPTFERVRQAAYQRWLRRGSPHGGDLGDWFAAENELSFSLNYQMIAEYPLDGPGALILNDRRARYCRFCERTAVQTLFGAPAPLLSGGWSPSLATSSVCNECRAGFRDAQAARLERFRAILAEGACRSEGGAGGGGSGSYSLGVFKALAGCALLIMPESELGYFVDALEWVSNPHDKGDRRVLERDATCVVYLAPFWGERSWVTLARRIEKDAPLPYMVYLQAMRGVLMQIQVPLCIRDQDLDGRAVCCPRRWFAVGEGESFEEAQVVELRVERE